jgi:hypothetical protein
MRGRRRAKIFAVLAWSLGFGLSGGCAFGPQALERSHGLYNEAIRRVDQEQLLRNLVHMRYNEIRLSVNVSSIAAQYELAGGAEARPFFSAPNPAGSTFRTFTSVLPDVNVSGANRPTVTFIPADNGDAIRKFLAPISVETFTFLHQTSWPVSTVARLWVERVNGVPNAATASGPQQDLVPDFERFRRLAALLQMAQDQGLGTVRPEDREVEVSGALPASAITASAAVDAAKNDMEYRQRADGAWSLVRKERQLVMEMPAAAAGHPVLEEMRSLMNLRPGLTRYDVVDVPGIEPDPLFYPTPPSTQVRVSLRSSAQVYFYLANGVEVPPEHLAAGIVRLPRLPDGSMFDTRAVTEGLFTVHACQGHKPPPTAYVAIKYRGYWYYIDDRDQETKATFALVLSISRLDFAQAQTSGPVLTLPVGR